jgi:hypothetical protein
MSRVITFKDLEIHYQHKPKLKHSYISLKPHSSGVDIYLKTPNKSSLFLENLLKEKESWIRKSLLKLQKNRTKPLNLEDEVLLFGEYYSIDANEVQELKQKLSKVESGDSIKVLKCYDEFYKAKAKEHLSEVLQRYAQLMNLEFSELKFRKMKSRWGSCSSKRVITLNSELMKVKKELIEYVVVHELAHLVHMNHSKLFHTLVDEYIPNSKAKRKELKSIYPSTLSYV